MRLPKKNKPRSFERGKEICTTSCRWLFILCSRYSYDHFTCPQCNCERLGEPNPGNQAKSLPIIRLHGKPPKSNNSILRIGYDTQCAFRCILHVCRKRQKPRRRKYLSGKHANRRQADQIEWQHPHHMCHPQVSCSISSRNRTGSVIP